MLEYFGYAGIAPHGRNCLSDSDIEGLLWVRVDRVVEEVFAVFVVARAFGRNLELAHGTDEGFCAIDDILVYGQAVHGQLFLGVTVLMDNLHLLDDGGLAAFARAWDAALAVVKEGVGAGQLTQQQDLALSP